MYNIYDRVTNMLWILVEIYFLYNNFVPDTILKRDFHVYLTTMIRLGKLKYRTRQDKLDIPSIRLKPALQMIFT